MCQPRAVKCVARLHAAPAGGAAAALECLISRSGPHPTPDVPLATSTAATRQRALAPHTPPAPRSAQPSRRAPGGGRSARQPRVDESRGHLGRRPAAAAAACRPPVVPSQPSAARAGAAMDIWQANSLAPARPLRIATLAAYLGALPGQGACRGRPCRHGSSFESPPPGAGVAQ